MSFSNEVMIKSYIGKYDGPNGCPPRHPQNEFSVFWFTSVRHFMLVGKCTQYSLGRGLMLISDDFILCSVFNSLFLVEYHVSSLVSFQV